jgi:hypothetical protein
MTSCVFDHQQLRISYASTPATSVATLPTNCGQVINWAFGLLLQAAAQAQPHSSPTAGSSRATATTSAISTSSDAKPLVSVTGLLRVLWDCVYEEGVPVNLRGVLLVAMALRNLLLVVALPLWARKAVAAQLRAWQEGLSSAQACNPTNHIGEVKLVHVLRVLKEVRGRAVAFHTNLCFASGDCMQGLLPLASCAWSPFCHHHWLHLDQRVGPTAYLLQPPCHPCLPLLSTTSLISWQAEQLCQHGWDHPTMAAALQSGGSSSASPSAAGEEPQLYHPAASSQLLLMEEPGLVLLRMEYLMFLEQRTAYLNLALAGKQWGPAIIALLRSGDR